MKYLYTIDRYAERDVHVLIRARSSKMDYCNSILVGVTKTLQRRQYLMSRLDWCSQPQNRNT